MSQFLKIHPQNPQERLIKQTVEVIRSGGLVVYPTDSLYAIGCQLGDKNALDRIRAIRKADQNHNFTLICRDLTEIATYARVENAVFRILKAVTPGAYTFILKATREVPRRLLHPKKKTIGIRIPDHKITQAILAELNEPLLSTTLLLPGHSELIVDPYAIEEIIGHAVDLIIDGTECGTEPTTVVDMLDGAVKITREGKGDIAMLS